jgi:putative tryptophan/tyrosine transport system substrate-binding protein
MTRRRSVLAALALGFAFSGAGAAAQERVPRIGVLTYPLGRESKAAWLEGLSKHGYRDGHNLAIEYRFYGREVEQIPVLAAELAALGLELVVANSASAVLATQAAAPNIPLVFLNVGDPVGIGLVKSLARPGGHATGISGVVPDGFVGKGLQLLKEFVPQVSQFAVLVNPSNPNHARVRRDQPEIERGLAIRLSIVEANGPEQYEHAFETASRLGAAAIYVSGDPLAHFHSKQIVALAARYRMPALYYPKSIVLQGGLILFSTNPAEEWRRATAYVDKILKGARPADLPVEQPTRYYIAVNGKTAAALGLTIPPSILAQADEVIE